MAAKKAACREPVVNVTTITREQWLEYRRSGIGGSDAATIVGLNPFSSPYYLFCDKMGALPEKEDTEAMRQGRDLEQYVAERWMERTGKRVKRNNTMWRSTVWPWMLADIDREVVGENAGLECKTTSLYNKHDFAGGEIPLTYYVQCQHYMAVMGFERMYLAVLVLNRGFYDFVIERDEKEIDTLAAAEGEFWRMVEDETPPDIDGSEATVNAIRAMHPDEVPDTFCPLSKRTDEDLDRMQSVQAFLKDLEKECDAIKARVMDEMGEASDGESANFVCTWKTRTRETVDAKKLKREHPEIYDKCVKKSSFRTFSVKPRSEQDL